MNLEEAMDIVVNEAEVSALGDKTDEQLKILSAVEVVQSFYEDHGYHFANYTMEETGNTPYST